MSGARKSHDYLLPALIMVCIVTMLSVLALGPTFMAARDWFRKQHNWLKNAKRERDKAEAENARLKDALAKLEEWIDGLTCQCDPEVGHVCDRCYLARIARAALGKDKP